MIGLVMKLVLSPWTLCVMTITVVSGTYVKEEGKRKSFAEMESVLCCFPLKCNELYNIMLLLLMLFSQKANECALNTECVPIVDCPFIRDSFSLIKRKPYCNLDRDGTNVCCLKPPQNYTQPKDFDLRIVRGIVINLFTEILKYFSQ